MKIGQVIGLCALSVGIFCGSVVAEDKKLFHVRTSLADFESFYHDNKASIDVWSRKLTEDGVVDASVYAIPSVMEQLRSGRSLRGADGLTPTRVLEPMEDTTAAAEEAQAKVDECQRQTQGYLDLVSVPFTGSAFHECWRRSSQIFEYLDKLVSLSPDFFSKIESIGETYEGQKIPVYKISINANTKLALYGQSLIHAREWQSGGAVVYVISGLLDALHRGDSQVMSIFQKYDWYFTPVLNIDGYDFTWEPANRLWRKNRHPFKVNDQDFVGVDLNRNFGPRDYFDLAHDSKVPDSEIYPGTGVLSERESSAVFSFLHKLPQKLVGAIDVHMNSQTIIRPFSNQVTEASEPFMDKLVTLGDAMRIAIQGNSGLEYGNVMGGTGHYLAFGTFKDSVFLEFNYAPAYTLELEPVNGGFISEQSEIRDVGRRTLDAFIAFSEGIEAYWA